MAKGTLEKQFGNGLCHERLPRTGFTHHDDIDFPISTSFSVYFACKRCRGL